MDTTNQEKNVATGGEVTDCQIFHETNQYVFAIFKRCLQSISHFVLAVFVAVFVASCLFLALFSIAAILGCDAVSAFFPPHNGKPVFSPMTRVQGFLVLSFLTLLAGAVIVTVDSGVRYWRGMIQCILGRSKDREHTDQKEGREE